MRTYERKVQITDKVEIIELNKCIAVKADIKSQLKNDEFFVSHEDAGLWTKNPYKLVDVKKKYLYFSDKFWKLANSAGLSNSKLWDLFPNCIIKPSEAVELEDFDEDKVVWFDVSSHLLYKLGATNPVSMPYHKDYIGGITDQDFDLKKVKEILSKNPNVIKSEITEIPYYNRDSGYQALDFVVRLPQETHDSLCNYLRDVKKQEFWMVRIKEMLVWRPYYDEYYGKDINTDLLGIKDCYIGKRE